MKEKTPVDELQSFFSSYNEYLKSINERVERMERKIDEIHKKITSEKEPLPKLDTLDKLTEGKSPILRRWTDGKYKCSSLEEFVKAYIIIADNLTSALIRDYLISERTKNPYTDNSIEKALTLHGPGRK
jgi:hypothetical protein